MLIVSICVKRKDELSFIHSHKLDIMKKSIKNLESKKVLNLKAIKGGHPGKGYSRPRPANNYSSGHVTIIK